jgi:hypothetical protein
MKNNTTQRLIILVLLTLSLQGCFLNPIMGPGYWVSIEVTDPNFLRENMSQFDQIAIREQFKKVKTAEETNWYCDYYHYDSSEKYKSLEIMMSYDKKEMN